MTVGTPTLTSEMLPEESGDGGFVHLSFGHSTYCLFEYILAGFDFHTVKGQKYQGGHRSGSLVAVHKGMVPYDMKKIGRSHLEKVTVQIATAEPGCRHCKGGLEKPQVPDTGLSSVSFNLVPMDLQHFGETEEIRCHTSVRQFLESLTVTAVRCLQSLFEFFLTLGVTYGGNDEHLSVSGNIKRGVSVYLQKIEDGTVDHQRQTVSMFSQILDHGFISIWSTIVITMYHQEKGLSTGRTRTVTGENPVLQNEHGIPMVVLTGSKSFEGLFKGSVHQVGIDLR